ncbi:hypothetical protein BNJ_00041 [Kaumoebavirus]|uniref:hypothetical protein n=1 Tax=Kaumoebavirus TaxID=1859492 RepID=UPI0009C225FA|nr:hypothetical protein BNJ_00041 [Kaumoebavirus]ARA71884.1 hypothetical protein BNJ_00041 [Kaumoebavirus]
MDEVASNSKNYENFALRKGFQFKEIEKSLEVIREFVIRKGLIIYGGMAINFGLILHGDRIYEDDEIPDYDVYSSNFFEDACELGDILTKAGYPNVSVINAKHMTTMKVRINFEPVLDLTYIPEPILKKVPYMVYKNFRFVHPNYQKIDLYRSLSLPLENAPLENIFFRWRKDLKRLGLLDKYYTLERPEAKEAKGWKAVELPAELSISDDIAWGGILAYAIYAYIFQQLFQTYKTAAVFQRHASIKTMLKDFPQGVNELAKLNVEKSGKILAILIPTRIIEEAKEKDFQIPLNILVHRNLDTILSGKKYREFEEYLALKPEQYVVGGKKDPVAIEFYDTSHLLIPAVSPGPLMKEWGMPNINWTVPTIPYLLLYFLQRYYETGMGMFLEFYHGIRDMEKVLNELLKVTEELDEDLVDSLFNNVPIFPSLANILGKDNISHEYVAYKEDYNAKLSGEVTNNRPPSYFPGRAERPHFDLKLSKYFAITGTEKTI